MRKTNGAKPIREFQAGALFAAVWAEPGKGNSIQHSIRIEKRYRDERSGQWKTTGYLRPDELPKLALVAMKVYEDLVFRTRTHNGH